MEFRNWFMEYSVLQIAGMIGFILIFLLLLFEANWLMFKYMKYYNDEK
ncbi:MAG: hypothetical protein IPF54_16505 [Draconibacterium sp.]|nr:hypothetical protein [Draconibacterium sp.]